MFKFYCQFLKLLRSLLEMLQDLDAKAGAFPFVQVIAGCDFREFFETAVPKGARRVDAGADGASVEWMLNTCYTDRLLLSAHHSASVLSSF